MKKTDAEERAMQKARRNRRAESGVVLLIAIFVLMLVSVIAIALIVSSGTETALASNYRSSAAVYYAAMAGLEEARQRLQPKSPDSFNATVAGFMPPTATQLPLSSVRYIVNLSGGDTVVPYDPTNPYYDTEYLKEFFPTAITGVPDVQVIPSISGTNADGLPGPVFKWVRINAVTEWSLHVDVDHDTAYDPTTVLYYDPQHTEFGTVRPSLIKTGSPPASAVQALELTALAVLPNGSQKLLQYVVAPTVLTMPLFAAVTMDGNGVLFSATSSGSFFVEGTDQPTCVPAATPVYAVGYTNPGDSGNINTSNPSHYPGQTAAPSVGQVGASLPANWKTPSGLEAEVQTIKGFPGAVDIAPPGGPGVLGTAHPSDFPIAMSATHPMTIVVDGNLDVTGWNGTGYGLLLVTGDLNWDPGASWRGIVLVIGQGHLFSSSGGSGRIEGAVFVAHSHHDPPDLSILSDPSLGAAQFNMSGGNGVYYNSCWIAASLPAQNYHVLSFREVPQ